MGESLERGTGWAATRLARVSARSRLSLSGRLRASGLGGASLRPRHVHSRGLARAWPRAPPPSAGSKGAASAEAGSERSGGSHRGSRRPLGSGPAGHSGTGVREGVSGLHPTGSHGPLRRWGGRGRPWSVPDPVGWLRPQPPPPPSCGEVGLRHRVRWGRGQAPGWVGRRRETESRWQGSIVRGWHHFLWLPERIPSLAMRKGYGSRRSPQGQYPIFFPLQSPGVPP